MKYRIEYANGRRCSFANNRTELLECLREPKGKVTDIRKVYKNGVSDSVVEKYERYIKSNE